MNLPATTADEMIALPALVDRAAARLASARSAAEVLDARDMAAFAYDQAKIAARIAVAKGAHDELVAKAHRAQADALLIESRAKRRLADEYDAAQERGEVGQSGSRTDLVPNGNEVPPTAADIGINRKDIHDARIIRDAEVADPGVIERTVRHAVETGRGPTRSEVRRVAREAARRPAPAPARGKDAMCVRVKDALMALASLPPAHEVAGYFAGSDLAVIVDEQLPAAAQWLNDFFEAWGDPDNA